MVRRTTRARRRTRGSSSSAGIRTRGCSSSRARSSARSAVRHIEDDDFGSEEQASKLEDGHRFRVGVGAFGFGDWAKTSRKIFVESRQVAIGGDGEQLVGEIHKNAVIARGVIGESDAQLTGHEGLFTRGREEMVEASEQLVARGVIEGQPPADSRAERQELGGPESLGQAASPAKMTQSSCLESSSLLARMRSSHTRRIRAQPSLKLRPVLRRDLKLLRLCHPPNKTYPIHERRRMGRNEDLRSLGV